MSRKLGREIQQHLDNVRRKSSAQRSVNSRVSVHLCNDSASNIASSAIRVHVRYQPDLQRQVLALLRLLGHLTISIEAEQPQGVPPGASTGAAAGNGSHNWSGYSDGTKNDPSRR